MSAIDAVSNELDLEQIESTDVSRPEAAQIVQQILAEMTAAGKPAYVRSAFRTIKMLKRATRIARRVNYTRAYRLAPDELMIVHPVLEVIMPDDVIIPKPGSAHELLQRYLLQGDEFALVHTREGRNLCVVAVRTQRI